MSKTISELLSRLPSWEAALENDGRIDEENRVTISEAIATADAPWLFPKVISRTLKEAAEPQLLVTPLLSTVRLGKTRSFGFSALNAIQASEIPEAQEYPEQALAIAEQVEGKVSKKGVKLAFTEEVITDSMWDIVGLHVRAAGRAMARLKEQIALSRFRTAASVVFDNDDAAVDDTTGLGSDGNPNDTITWDDVVEMTAVLVAQNHVPTDFIMHPLMWSLFLRNASFYGSGANVERAWGFSPRTADAALNATAPMGINVIVSPFVSFTARAGATPAKSDVFLIDRNEIGVHMIKDDLSVDEWNDPTRDIRSMKLKERYDIVLPGGGDGVTVAKNVNLARNYDIVLTNEV